MPFDAFGVFTNVAGATTAQAGDVIRSATWDNIHTDYAQAFTQLGQQSIQAPRYVTAAGNVQVTVNDSVVVIQAAAAIINLPAGATRTAPVTIVGGAVGIFSASNSVITPVGGDTISGLATVTLTSDYQSITLLPLTAGGYLIV